MGNIIAAIAPSRLVESVQIRDFMGLRALLRTHEVADIAESLSQLETKDLLVLFRLLPRNRRVGIFSYLPFESQFELLMELPDRAVSILIDEMEADDRTKLLEDLPIEVRNQLLLKLSPEERSVAWKLLSYPEDSVGRLMTPEFLALDKQMTAAQALDYIRWTKTLPTDHLSNLFVTASDGRLLGEISLATLVLCDPPTEFVGNIMVNRFASLHPSENQEVAVDYFRKYDRTCLPVVEQNNTLVGIVTADDLFDVAEEEATEDIQQFAGHGALENSYFKTPILTMLKKRAGWLLFLFLGMLISGTILRNFEDTLERLTYLVIFLPVIISSGGNSGTQAASLIIRGIALNEMQSGDWRKVFGRELFTGLALGVILATVGFLRAYTWDYPIRVGLTVAITLIGVVTFGAVAGSMLPFFFKKIKLDPAVVSSPFIATLVDLTGIVIFIKVAVMVTNFFGV